VQAEACSGVQCYRVQALGRSSRRRVPSHHKTVPAGLSGFPYQPGGSPIKGRSCPVDARPDSALPPPESVGRRSMSCPLERNDPTALRSST